MELLFLQAAESAARGDFRNAIVRRARRVGELIETARRCMEEAEAAGEMSCHPTS
jgi:hypothetical protein